MICAGCQSRYSAEKTKFYRRKRWCGGDSCKEVIDTKVKHANYIKQQKKIKNGTFRHGVDAELREYIKTRDHHKCQKCFAFGDQINLQVHHIVPVSDGGTDDRSNLILLCSSCHTRVHQDGYKRYIKKFSKYSRSIEQLVQ